MLPDNYVEVLQQSPEWLEMRKGMVTGSMVRDAIAKMKSQPAVSANCETGKHGACKGSRCTCTCHGERVVSVYQQCRQDYMEDVVAVRLTGQMSDRYVSKAMKEGVEREELALAAYENKFNVLVEPIGFVYHPKIQWYGCSPDGLLGTDIVIEAKCPTQATHIRYMREYQQAKKSGLDWVPEEYLPQIKAELSCTGRPVCEFISFHPDFPAKQRLLVSQWRYDREMIQQQDAEVVKFLNEAAELEQEIRNIEF